MKTVKDARRFAIDAHGEQKYGDHPYIYHLDNVVGVLSKYTSDENLLKAGYLHDVLEDTDVDYDTLKKEFGDEVADLVWRVTDEPGNNRLERKTKTYPKIRASYDASILKTADRIANVKESKGNPLFKMYAKEHHDFIQGIIGNQAYGTLMLLKNELEDLFK